MTLSLSHSLSLSGFCCLLHFNLNSNLNRQYTYIITTYAIPFEHTFHIGTYNINSMSTWSRTYSILIRNKAMQTNGRQKDWICLFHFPCFSVLYKMKIANMKSLWKVLVYSKCTRKIARVAFFRFSVVNYVVLGIGTDIICVRLQWTHSVHAQDRSDSDENDW